MAGEISVNDTIAPSTGIPPRSLYDQLGEPLARYIAAKGFPKFHAAQVERWLLRQPVASVDEMSDLPESLREQLARDFTLSSSALHEMHLSKDGSRKFLFRTYDGKFIESVLIHQPRRRTLCVSSQVGCAMGCRFCRTGTMGLVRNLSMGEILEQVAYIRRFARSVDEDFGNIVFMGMGEPLHNFDAVNSALKWLTAPKGFGFAPRRITISSVGLVPAIQRFVEVGPPVQLAISLNATTDEVRSEIMPINRRYPIEVLLDCIKEYPVRAKRRVTFEYVLLAGLTDTPADQERLVSLLRGMDVKVNLIPYNENTGLGFKAPTRRWAIEWSQALQRSGLNATVRFSKGQDISAACGQLATESKRRERRAAQMAESGVDSTSPTLYPN